MKERSNLRACLDPVQLPFFPDGVHVRCGKCANCLKHKGNELAVRVYREGISHGFAHWITLTYENAHCPICEHLTLVNVNTGEIVRDEGLKFVDEQDYFFQNAPFEWRRNKNARPTKRYFPLVEEFQSEALFDSPLVWHRELYFSVDMSAFQLYMKRFRHLLPEKYKESFRYIAVPEYGGVGYRPHIHLVVCGIPIDVFQPFLEVWSSECGYQNDIDTIDFSQSTASESIGKVSSYVSKYACKGKYDCPFIGWNCRKPRRCASIDFGCGSPGLWDRLESHLLAYDVYGLYDLFDETDPILPMVSPRLLLSRRYCVIGDYPYPVPRLFIDKLFRRRRSVPRGYARYVYTNQEHRSYRVLKFYKILKNGEKEWFSFPRIDYSGDAWLSSDPSYRCIFTQQSTRYYVETSSLQKEITNLVLVDLSKDAQRKFQSVERSIKNDGFALSLAKERGVESLYRYSVIRSLQSDIERSVF